MSSDHKSDPDKTLIYDDRDTVIPGQNSEDGVVEDLPVPIDPRFQFVQHLGKGGIGQVYLAFDGKLQRQVALKFLLNPDPERIQVLVAEARAQA